MSITSLVLLAATSLGAAAMPEIPQQTPDLYAVAGERIAIAPGRALNLRCTGEGPQTVLLEAGGNADSTTWLRVQPLLAAQARVCAYDRAGYGFSDEGPLPRDLDAHVADLAALVAAAQLRTPLVLVGHSLGSNIVRRYARQYPRQVRALVLVDPPEQAADELLPAAWKTQGERATAQRNALLDACLQAAESGALEGAEGPLASCLRAPPAWQSAPVAAAARASKLRPGYWRALRSQLDANAAIFGRPVPEDESHGDTPVVVLAAPAGNDGLPEDVAAALHEARERTRARLVASSRQGRRIDVPGSTHEIQLDAPQAVAQAVSGVLARGP